MQAMHLAHTVSPLNKDELFLFIILYPEEANHKKTARFLGVISLLKKIFFN